LALAGTRPSDRSKGREREALGVAHPPKGEAMLGPGPFGGSGGKPFKSSILAQGTGRVRTGGGGFIQSKNSVGGGIGRIGAGYDQMSPRPHLVEMTGRAGGGGGGGERGGERGGESYSYSMDLTMVTVGLCDKGYEVTRRHHGCE
jgi:hypothetical protein